MQQPYVMVIDNASEILALYEQLLQEEGFEFSLHAHYDEAIFRQAQQRKPDVVVLDMMFDREITGWKIIQRFRQDEDTRAIPIVVCSAANKTLRQLREELNSENVEVVLKPFDLDSFLYKVKAKIPATTVSEC
jgi:CheY-like chemotaxis protein